MKRQCEICLEPRTCGHYCSLHHKLICLAGLSPARLMEEPPCSTCLELALEGKLRAEAVQPLPPPGQAPLGLDRRPQCHDCAAAGTLVRLGVVPSFEHARVATANDRQEQYRLPGAPIGLVGSRLMRPSQPGDLEKQHKWLKTHKWFGMDPDDAP